MSFIINPYRFGVVATFNPATDTLADSIALDGSIAEFMYSSPGSPPGGGASLDDIAMDVAIVNFSYTT